MSISNVSLSTTIIDGFKSIHISCKLGNDIYRSYFDKFVECQKPKQMLTSDACFEVIVDKMKGKHFEYRHNIETDTLDIIISYLLGHSIILTLNKSDQDMRSVSQIAIDNLTKENQNLRDENKNLRDQIIMLKRQMIYTV